MIKHPADIITWAALLWVAIVLLLNFVIPTDWYFQYDRLETTDVCSGETHLITGYYWAALDIPANGIDHVVSVETGNRKDRFPWEQGLYNQGTNSGSWNHRADLLPGEYYIESTELKLSLFRIFPVYLNSDERPRSNTFTVLDCK
jgi:hypothetical protein